MNQVVSDHARTVKVLKRTTYMASAAVAICVGVAGGSTAYAQTTSPTTDSEDIVVTAQRGSAENIIDVPISVTAVSGSTLENIGARGAADGLSLVGGVNLIQNQPGDTTISIRGSSASLFSAPAIGYYLDEMPFSFVSFNLLPDAGAYDLERIEVLRGPQGTLFGVGALNGVVRIITRDADLSKFSINARSTLSSTRHGGTNFGGDVAINVPLVTEKLAVRGVVSYADLSGFVDGPGGKNINDSKVGTYRFKLNAAPSERLTIEAGVNISRIDNGAPSRSDRNYTTFFTGPSDDHRDYEAYSLEIGYDAGLFNIVSATNYMNFRTDTGNDILLSGVLPVNIVQAVDAEVISQELRANSDFDGPWGLSGGLFYRDVRQSLSQAVPGLGLTSPFFTKDRSKAYAIFGELNRRFGEAFRLAFGLRYFHDKTSTNSISDFSGPTGVTLDDSYGKVTYRAVASYEFAKAANVYASVATGFRSGYAQLPSTLAPEKLPVRPDSLITYETGIKGASSDRKISYDVAAYYTKWKDVIQEVLNGNGVSFNQNSGSVSGFGIDANLTLRPVRGLMLQASLGWNDLTYDADYVVAGAVLYRKGTRLNFSPKYTAGLLADFETPLNDGLAVHFGSAIRYNSRMLSRGLGATGATVRASDTIFEARIQAGVKSERWSVDLFADNLTNENRALNAPEEAYPLPVRMRPRTIGLQASLHY